MKLLHHKVMIGNQPVNHVILVDGDKVILSSVNFSIIVPKACFDKAYKILGDYDTLIKAYNWLSNKTLKDLTYFYGYFSKYNIVVKISTREYYYYFSEQLNGSGNEEEVVNIINGELKKIGVI